MSGTLKWHFRILQSVKCGHRQRYLTVVLKFCKSERSIVMTVSPASRTMIRSESIIVFRRCAFTLKESFFQPDNTAYETIARRLLEENVLVNSVDDHFRTPFCKVRVFPKSDTSIQKRSLFHCSTLL